MNIEELKKEVEKRLAVKGIKPDEYEWRTGFGTNGDNTYLRYQYWRTLPMEAYNTISSLMWEECYEDDDGDDCGKPIIRKLYSYHFNHGQ